MSAGRISFPFPAVAGYVRDMEALGMKGALEKFLA